MTPEKRSPDAGLSKSVRTAVLYVRVSSKDQEREGFSIPAQWNLLREYALDKRLVIEKEFEDVETAKQAGRSGFGEMIAFLQKTKSCQILVEIGRAHV